MSCKAAVRHSGKIAIVDLSGRLCLGEGSGLVRNTIKNLITSGTSDILLNLAGVTYIDSAGLGELVGSYASATSGGGKIKLLNAQGKVSEVLTITKLYTVFESFGDEAGASQLRRIPLRLEPAPGGRRRPTAKQNSYERHGDKGSARNAPYLQGLAPGSRPPDAAEQPRSGGGGGSRGLIVYGGTGRAARDWPSFHAIVRALESLENDETLLVQSGRPVGVFRTHRGSAARAHRQRQPGGPLVQLGRVHAPGAAGPDDVRADDRRARGSTSAARALFRERSRRLPPWRGNISAGRSRASVVVSGGMGGMGGAQPLAATMNGACFLGIEVDPQRIERRIETGYCDRMAHDWTKRCALTKRVAQEAISVGLVGNCADVLPELVRRGFVPDALTDQTSAHDPLNGYVPNGMTLRGGAGAARGRPGRVRARAPWPPWARTSRRCWRCSARAR